MNPQAIIDYTTSNQELAQQSYQQKNGYSITAELKTIINSLVDRELRRELQGTKHRLSAGYLMEPLWKAYLLSFILNMDCTNDLVRKLEENPSFAEISGFNMDLPLPSRKTFDRMVITLSEHPEIIEKLIHKAVDQLKEKLPDFGVTVAIDSTPIKSHSNPHKQEISDREAGFIAKEGISNKVWKWGYKLHMVSDTAWEIPITCEVSLAKDSDMTRLIPLLEKARERFSWFKPWHVVADRGYDAGYNYKAIHDAGAIPIIKMVNRTKTNPDDRYRLDELGIPHCKAGIALLLKDRNKKTGMRYICPHRAGRYDCPLADECRLKVARIAPFREYRKFCPIPRDSDQWNALYDKRTAIERVNSKLKEHRRLNSHCHRGLAKVRLHGLMSVLSLLVTSLAEANANCTDRVRACTRKVV